MCIVLSFFTMDQSRYILYEDTTPSQDEIRDEGIKESDAVAPVNVQFQ